VGEKTSHVDLRSLASTNDALPIRGKRGEERRKAKETTKKNTHTHKSIDCQT
jgi:hypothetical protein